ncbi:hypothetical protein EIL81_24890 [Photorhabdus laumondii subsp. laumondii]|nr:hypothetical protein [Photorhabdus laumondii subsp. laumondii]
MSILADERLFRFYTRHLSSCLFVGCTHSPRSHSYLCSRGFAPLPPRSILKSIGYTTKSISCSETSLKSVPFRKY